MLIHGYRGQHVIVKIAHQQYAEAWIVSHDGVSYKVRFAEGQDVSNVYGWSAVHNTWRYRDGLIVAFQDQAGLTDAD